VAKQLACVHKIRFFQRTLTNYSIYQQNSCQFVTKKTTASALPQPNFQNLSKVAFSTLFLTKTTPLLIKTISKLYYFLTLFDGIFYFLRFRASAFPQFFCCGFAPIQRTYATHLLLRFHAGRCLKN